MFLMPRTADYYHVNSFTAEAAAGLLAVLFSSNENSDLARLRISIETEETFSAEQKNGDFPTKTLSFAAREALSGELTDLARALRDEAISEARNASRWNFTHLALGLPTAILAAVAGATALADAAGRIPAAILALIAAAMSATASFLACDAKANAAQQRAAALDTAATDARLLLAGDRNDAEGLRSQTVLLVDRVEAIRARDLNAANILKQRQRER